MNEIVVRLEDMAMRNYAAAQVRWDGQSEKGVREEVGYRDSPARQRYSTACRMSLNDMLNVKNLWKYRLFIKYCVFP